MSSSSVLCTSLLLIASTKVPPARSKQVSEKEAGRELASKRKTCWRRISEGAVDGNGCAVVVNDSVLEDTLCQHTTSRRGRWAKEPWAEQLRPMSSDAPKLVSGSAISVLDTAYRPRRQVALL
eukprot:853953-Rhodomonas_salina.1